MICEIKNDLNILVIGDIMVDHYIYGNCKRISPEAPVPVVEITMESHRLGGAGNVLQNIRSFECRTNIVSVVGDDDNASIVLSELALSKISGEGIVKDEDRCTIMKSRVLVSNHQLIRLDREVVQPINEKIEGRILNYLKAHLVQHDIVLISDYDKGLLTPSLLASILSLCRKYEIQSIVDPKGGDFSKYKGVNIIKPNKKEAIIASGIDIVDAQSLTAVCMKIQELTDCDSVVITMSEDGIAMFNGGKLEIIPTKALDVIDVTGAGDTVLAALGVALASGNSLYASCNFANHAAAVVVSKVGSATASLEEVSKNFED
ncbi:hypothetical protein A0256_16680 [Mucilaginibacter sp. PAMC 26640]|nr:hypothetical protein A0256_16680 [Mucilaginibacter sp. PAMC 26640]